MIDFKSQELFPCLSTKASAVSPTWEKSKMPGLVLRMDDSFERLDIPSNQLVKTLGNTLSDICKSVMTRHKVSVEVSPNKTTGMVTLIIHGSPENVKISKRELLSLLTVPVKITLSIPNSTRPMIIGKGGLKLKELTNKTKAKVFIPKNEGEGEDGSKLMSVVIMGDEQGVVMARNEIMDIVEKHISNYREKVDVETSLLQFIAPSILGLEEEYKVKIHVPPVHVKDVKEQQDIVVIGKMEKVVQVLEKIRELIKDLVKSIKTVAVPLKKAQHRFVIGLKGAGKKEIFEKTGCLVIIPPQEDVSETITIRGPEHMLSTALQAVLEKANSILIANVDSRNLMSLGDAEITLYLRYLFSREKVSINEIQDQYSVNISRITSSPGILEVQGKSKLGLEQGIKSLNALILSHASTLYFTFINVTIDLFPYIIGKNGQNIQKMKNHPEIHGRLVDVMLPTEKDVSKKVGIVISRIQGSNDDVEKFTLVVSDILIADAKLSADNRTETINVDSSFHKRLIGAGGSMLKEILGSWENTVRIIFGSSKSDEVSKQNSVDQNLVFVKGNSEGVDCVSKKIKALVEEWKKVDILTSFSEKLRIAQDMLHALFIGYDDSMTELPSEMLGWLIRDVRAKINENPQLKEKFLKNEYGIYSHRTLNLRIAMDDSNLIVYGPKPILRLAVDSIQLKAQKITDTYVSEFCLFDSDLAKELFSSDPNVWNRILGRLIGKQGRNIKSLGQKYNVDIALGSQGLPTDAVGNTESLSIETGHIRLKGLKSDVVFAQEQMLDLVNSELQKAHILEFEVPSTIISGIFSRGELNRYKIKDKYSVNITMEETGDTTKMILEGEKGKCESVRSLLLEKVDYMINQAEIELRIPFYLHHKIIGPGGETVKKLINSFGGSNKIVIDVPKISSNYSDIINIRCHKSMISAVESSIDETLNECLFGGNKKMEFSSLYETGIKEFLTLSISDFKKFFGEKGDKLFGISQKYFAFCFIEIGNSSIIKIRLVGETQKAIESLKDYINNETEISETIQFPEILKNKIGEAGSSESYWAQNLIYKAKKDLKIAFDSEQSSHQFIFKSTKREINLLKGFLSSQFQQMENNSFMDHVHLPKSAISHIVGKGGKTLKRIRQMSSTMIDIFEDEKNGNNTALICGKSLKSLEAAKDEIIKILNDYNSRLEEKIVVKSNQPKDHKFPPGYGDNFSRSNLRRSNDNILQNTKCFQSLDNQMNIELNSGNQHAVGAHGQLDALKVGLESPTVSPLDENQWKTIKGGKIVDGQVLPASKKKKKKKKDQSINGATDVLKLDDN